MLELKKDPLVLISFVVLAIGLGVLCALKVITWPQVIVGLGVLSAPSILGRKKDDAPGPPPALVLLLVGASVWTGACASLTPEQAGGATKDACVIVQALSGSRVVDSICASAPELVELTKAALDARAAKDGGARGVIACRNISGTGTCASEEEIATAILVVRARR